MYFEARQSRKNSICHQLALKSKLNLARLHIRPYILLLKTWLQQYQKVKSCLNKAQFADFVNQQKTCSNSNSSCARVYKYIQKPGIRLSSSLSYSPINNKLCQRRIQIVSAAGLTLCSSAKVQIIMPIYEPWKLGSTNAFCSLHRAVKTERSPWSKDQQISPSFFSLKKLTVLNCNL